MAAVSFSDLSKSFGSTHVISGVSLEIPDGSFVVLVGPSGCGKSTLLRMTAGLETIDRGEIRIGGRLVNTLPPRDRDVAMVFQNYALYPHLTVAGNMGFSLKLRGERQELIEEKVRDTAAVLGLLPYLDRLPRQLSGGQRQRVAIGRAIVRAPQVYLFDEPLSNLDVGLRAQMRTELKELQQRLNTTTVYVTHDHVEAMTLADTIVVLQDGVVQQAGEPLDVYDRPANLFVAGFIGSPAMNVIEAQVQGDRGRGVLRLASGASLPVPEGFELAQGTRVAIGIRPEHITLGAVGLDAEVVAVEPTGAATHLAVRLAGQLITVVLGERVRAARGDTVRMALRRGALHLFEPATGRRIQPAATAPHPALFAG